MPFLYQVVKGWQHWVRWEIKLLRKSQNPYQVYLFHIHRGWISLHIFFLKAWSFSSITSGEMQVVSNPDAFQKIYGSAWTLNFLGVTSHSLPDAPAKLIGCPATETSLS